MVPYATITGTRSTQELMRRNGWRWIVTPANPRPVQDMRYGVDNGAWGAHTSGRAWDAAAFRALVERLGAEADFVVLPDVVGAGVRSLDISLSWLPFVLGHTAAPMLALQDGMSERDVLPALRAVPGLGLFLGGTTEWKLQSMPAWGAMAAVLSRPFHVARVNTRRRIRLCRESGATSIDGTSVTRFSSTMDLLDAASRQPSMLSMREGG